MRLLNVFALLGIFVAAITWLDRRSQYRHQQPASADENKPSNDLESWVTSRHPNPHQDPSEDRQHRAHERAHWKTEEAYWERQHWIERAALFLSAAAIIVAGGALSYTVATYHEAQKATAEAHRQADAARDQTNIARDALIATTRPWIKVVDFEPRFVSINNGVIAIRAGFKTINVGHSPVVRITAVPKIQRFMQGFLNAFHPGEICAEQKARGFAPLAGQAVFPDDSFKTEVSFSARIDSLLAEPVIPFPDALFPNDLLITGCIAYAFYGSNDVHMTTFYYHLRPLSGTFDLKVTTPQTFQKSDLQWDELTVGKYAD